MVEFGLFLSISFEATRQHVRGRNIAMVLYSIVVFWLRGFRAAGAPPPSAMSGGATRRKKRARVIESAAPLDRWRGGGGQGLNGQ